MMPDHKHNNRLARETSPYLLQHAHNPVDWYPWGPEAFAVAREQDRPIFLSVGYSTCYWCHVMERQCFEVESVAREMNARFINIKVDREERPDVDSLYMTAVQVLTRHGGWPMSVFLTPDLRPFYGGTYFPPTDAHGRPGFVTLLKGLDEAWHERREEVERSAAQLANILRQVARPPRPEKSVTINAGTIDRIVRDSLSNYDPQHGGFGGAPKFPQETLLHLAFDHLAHHPDDRRVAMLTHTLDAMALGGIRDQLGGGFHRYSTDAQWLVPHFEIMLYDNAMLGQIYVEAFRATENHHYAAVARGVFDFVLREMTSPDGAFFTAMDAEVDAMEGASYLWTAGEVEAVLGPDDAALINRVYGLDRGPNFVDPHHGDGVPDKSILYLDEFPDDALEARLAPMRARLKAVRDARKQPLLDTKVITSWNALMIRALAIGGATLNEPRYLSAAARAANFLLTKHRQADGRLVRASRDGVSKYDGFLDDYAFLAHALFALHEAEGNERWKDAAATIATDMLQRFADDADGGFFYTAVDANEPPVRQKVAGDSPLPSGNAVAAMVMQDLGHARIARDTITAFAAQLDEMGEGMSSLVQAAAKYVRQHGQIEVLTAPANPSTTGVLVEPPSDVLQIETRWVGARQLDVILLVSGGFHVNANEPGVGLIATRLSVSGDDVGVEAATYPPAVQRTFDFAPEPLPVYEGQFTITLRFAKPVVSPLRLALQYQACNDTACLAPVTKLIDVPAASP